MATGRCACAGIVPFLLTAPALGQHAEQDHLSRAMFALEKQLAQIAAPEKTSSTADMRRRRMTVYVRQLYILHTNSAIFNARPMRRPATAQSKRAQPVRAPHTRPIARPDRARSVNAPSPLGPLPPGPKPGFLAQKHPSPRSAPSKPEAETAPAPSPRLATTSEPLSAPGKGQKPSPATAKRTTRDLTEARTASPKPQASNKKKPHLQTASQATPPPRPRLVPAQKKAPPSGVVKKPPVSDASSSLVAPVPAFSRQGRARPSRQIKGTRPRRQADGVPALMPPSPIETKAAKPPRPVQPDLEPALIDRLFSKEMERARKARLARTASTKVAQASAISQSSVRHPEPGQHEDGKANPQAAEEKNYRAYLRHRPIGLRQLEAAACERQKKAQIDTEFSSISFTPMGCGASLVTTITTLGSPTVTLRPKATVNCRMSEAIGEWLDDAVQPAARNILGTTVREIAIAASYHCRRRNAKPSGKLSEHAFANAIDVSAIKLADGRHLTIAQDWNSDDEAVRKFLRRIHTRACGYFTTVIGPDGDAQHQNHLHFDLGWHGATGTYRICQ